MTVGFVKDKTQISAILKTLAQKKNLSAIALRAEAIEPNSLSQLRDLKSLLTLTLDRRYFHVRWINLNGP